MFRLLENTLLWKQKFDSDFRVYEVPFHKFDRRRIEELRLYWRQKGRSFNLSPGEAVFRAFEEFANEYYNKMFKNKDGSLSNIGERNCQDIARNLDHVAFFKDKAGNYNRSESTLSPLWRSFLEGYHEREKREDAERKARNQEVVSHRFPRDEIDAEWNCLISGDIHANAKIIWKSLNTKKTAHEVSEKTKLPLRDALYWIFTFREHALVREIVFNNEYFFVQYYLGPVDIERLDKQVKKLIDRLNN